MDLSNLTRKGLRPPRNDPIPPPFAPRRGGKGTGGFQGFQAPRKAFTTSSSFVHTKDGSSELKILQPKEAITPQPDSIEENSTQEDSLHEGDSMEEESADDEELFREHTSQMITDHGLDLVKQWFNLEASRVKKPKLSRSDATVVSKKSVKK